jgi:hypothetical protein
VIKYQSGSEFHYAYELNLSEEQAIQIAALIDGSVPSIRFDAKTIFPKRINEYRIFLTATPFPYRSQYLHENYLNGYNGDFEGKEVTIDFSLKARQIYISDSLLMTANVFVIILREEAKNELDKFPKNKRQKILEKATEISKERGLPYIITLDDVIMAKDEKEE